MTGSSQSWLLRTPSESSMWLEWLTPQAVICYCLGTSSGNWFESQLILAIGILCCGLTCWATAPTITLLLLIFAFHEKKKCSSWVRCLLELLSPPKFFAFHRKHPDWTLVFLDYTLIRWNVSQGNLSVCFCSLSGAHQNAQQTGSLPWHVCFWWMIPWLITAILCELWILTVTCQNSDYTT